MPTIDEIPETDETPEPIELEINPEKICFIILKAREFDAKVAPALPNEGPSPADDQERAILEDQEDDSTLQELRDAINGLNEDETIDLIAVAWVGRGDFKRADWDEARALANERHRRQSADYLTGIPLLGDYLAEGLEELGYDLEDYESGGSP
jgi:hypothetical protein